MEQRGEGIGTMADNINFLFGRDSDEGSGIQLEELKTKAGSEFYLRYDNSADEYGDGMARIYYCPMCGRKL